MKHMTLGTMYYDVTLFNKFCQRGHSSWYAWL